MTCVQRLHPAPSPSRALLPAALVLLGACRGPGGPAGEGRLDAAGWTAHEVEVGETRLQVRERGEGPAVLMHPSLGRGADDFLDLGDRVARAGYRVVRIDPRGIAGSTGPLDDVDLHDLADDVWAVADELGIERAFLLGQNFGNRVCRTASADRPGRVIGLLLLAAGGEVEPGPEVWAEFERVFDPSLAPERHLQAVEASFFAPGNDASVWRDGWYPAAARAQTEAAKRTADFDLVYAGGTAPVLVIQGQEDRIAPPVNAWNLVRRRPDARLLTLPDMGHAMLPENPVAIADGVCSFLDAHRDSSGAARMWATVQEYVGLGDHRVGTDVDRSTVAWFQGRLERLGGQVEQQPFSFERFDGTSEVRVDGELVPSLPLYYEAVGRVESDAPYVGVVDVLHGDRTSQALEDAIATARESGATLAVIACDNPLGVLRTPNRFPRLGSGLPVVLVPGRVAERLQKGEVHARFEARTVPGTSANVVARFGPAGSGDGPASGSASGSAPAGTAPAPKPILIATPLSGWFTCAAERATGIAVALELARRWGPVRPVLVVGSPGHEILHHVGLQAFLDANDLDPELVLHLGANVALGVHDPRTGEWALAPCATDPAHLPPAVRSLSVRMDPEAFAVLRPPLEDAGLHAILNPEHWSGEGELWAGAVSSPLLSFVGLSPEFHSPADVPEAVTSPELLRQVYDGIARAVEAHLRPASPSGS